MKYTKQYFLEYLLCKYPKYEMYYDAEMIFDISNILLKVDSKIKFEFLTYFNDYYNQAKRKEVDNNIKVIAFNILELSIKDKKQLDLELLNYLSRDDGFNDYSFIINSTDFILTINGQF